MACRAMGAKSLYTFSRPLSIERMLPHRHPRPHRTPLTHQTRTTVRVFPHPRATLSSQPDPVPINIAKPPPATTPSPPAPPHGAPLLNDLLSESEPTIFHTLPSESHLRLDKLLSARFPTVSRSYLQSLFSTRQILINGSPPPSKSTKAPPHSLISIQFTPPPRALPLTPEDLPLDILYQDAHLLAINKPPGIVTHPAPGHWSGTLVHALTYHYADIRELGGPRPGIVHRLDKGTSGILLVARTHTAQSRLMQQFAERRVKKQYVAITVGNPCGKGCTGRVVEAGIGRCGKDRMRMTVMSEEEGGKYARSTVRVHGRDERGLLHAVGVEIETGRTHQIRVHMRHCRAPVLGDELYGAVDVNWRWRGSVKRCMLHAGRVEFEHPVSGERVAVQARLAEDMREVMKGVYPGFEEEGW
eukprot:GFKZ01014076.1.p1 GENE.GFKZ01014076.1~~GFKZ01014076.1.p1  ORF type:complete len:415 (+),score=28.83 GFKZ01014076.1:414-1658(+)